MRSKTKNHSGESSDISDSSDSSDSDADINCPGCKQSIQKGSSIQRCSAPKGRRRRQAHGDEYERRRLLLQLFM